MSAKVIPTGLVVSPVLSVVSLITFLSFYPFLKRQAFLHYRRCSFLHHFFELISVSFF